jgi:hypothetical protein
VWRRRPQRYVHVLAAEQADEPEHRREVELVAPLQRDEYHARHVRQVVLEGLARVEGGDDHPEALLIHTSR